MSPTAKRACMAAASAVSATIPSYIAFRIVGWLGVGIVGLLIAFVANRIEVEEDGPTGHPQTPGLYAASRHSLDGADPAQRAEHRAAIAASRFAGGVAMIIGAVLALLGLGGFLLVQMPG